MDSLSFWMGKITYRSVLHQQCNPAHAICLCLSSCFLMLGLHRESYTCAAWAHTQPHSFIFLPFLSCSLVHCPFKGQCRQKLWVDSWSYTALTLQSLPSSLLCRMALCSLLCPVTLTCCWTGQNSPQFCYLTSSCRSFHCLTPSTHSDAGCVTDCCHFSCILEFFCFPASLEPKCLLFII